MATRSNPSSKTLRRVTHTSEIWLGDLARALSALQPQDDATRREIARALGFELREPELPPPTGTSPALPPTSVAPTQVPPRKTKPAPAPPTGAELPFKVTPLDPEPPHRTPRAASFDLLAATEKTAPPPFEPLFAPPLTRAILSGALATNGGDGDLDLERIIDTVARREFFDHLPSLPAPTLRRGAQVLIDQSEAMKIFARDQSELLKHIRLVMGADKTQAFGFRGLPMEVADFAASRFWGVYPLEADEPASDPRGDYVAPVAGTVVVLLTDLGIGQPALAANEPAPPYRWLEFARRVRQAGCPLIALVPYAAHRCDPALAQAIKILTWDRTTTATTVRLAFGHAHEVER